jgi:beta-N-acetylhexosaminidase
MKITRLFLGERHGLRLIWAQILFLGLACVAGAAPVQPGPALREPDTVWIESTLAGMTLDEKIGQMIMPGYSAGSADGLVTNWHVGGFIFQGNGNNGPSVLAATNHLQSIADTPLIFSTDCEAGLGARFLDATRFPLNMGSAAAYDLDLVQQQGRVTARECRAIGIQIGFGPVLDVNTEPVNPIIGTRSYSDNPSSVTALARAYVQGANAEGLLCTYKHFPGHGAAAFDSHLGLPTINISTAELQAKHVSPYAQLISEGTGDIVMTAHVWYPALDPGPTPWPATISNNALTGILRNQLAYQGCVISDSFAMGGLVQAAPTYDAVKYGVLAGLDIILTPASVADAFNGIKDRVLSNEIPESRIDAAVRRILALKSRAGMPETTVLPVEGLATVGHPANIAVAEQIAHKAIAWEISG